MTVAGSRLYLGTYDSEEAAAHAYDQRAKEELQKAILNFLPNGDLNPERKKKPTPENWVPKKKER